MSPSPVYFDYNATTPTDPQVREAFLRAWDRSWANPSSIHQSGRKARALLDDSRDRVASVFRCRPGELVFTSGGTESNNLAVLGTARRHANRGRHLICSPVEHPAVLNSHRYLASKEGFTLTILPVDDQGLVDPADLKLALRPDTVLVSILAANNETGVLQPVAELAACCRERGVLFHTDAVQWMGKEPLEGIASLGADLISFCAHKLHGPKGAGALYLRSPLPLDPVFLGGSQELNRRAGTENLPAIVALAETAERFVSPPVFPADRLRPWVARLAQAAADIEGVILVGSRAPRLANTLTLAVDRADSVSLLANLDLDGVQASSGSACSAGSVEPSHVLLAMGFAPALAASLVRLSLGRETTSAEVTRVADLLPHVIRRARAI